MVGMRVPDIRHTRDTDTGKTRRADLKQSHVGAIVAVVLVVVCVVDEGTVFLGNAITCAQNTKAMKRWGRTSTTSGCAFHGGG